MTEKKSKVSSDTTDSVNVDIRGKSKAGRPEGSTNKHGSSKPGPKPKIVSNTAGLSAEGICSIIKTCGEQKVCAFQVGDLYVTFKQSTDVFSPTEIPVVIADQSDGSDPDHLEPEYDAVQDSLDLLSIEDPVEFERQLNDEDFDGPQYQRT